MESARILVAGLLNVETSVRVDGFPVPCLPVDHPVDAAKTAASGVALNLACALVAQGDVPQVLSPVAGANHRSDARGRLGNLPEKGAWLTVRGGPRSVAAPRKDAPTRPVE